MHIRESRLRYIGAEGLTTLKSKSAAIMGLGAVGSVTAKLLAMMGLGKLILVDRDIVDSSNIMTQLYNYKDIGIPKAIAASEKILKMDSETDVICETKDITSENVSIIKGDIIADCTDNFSTRFLLDEYAFENNIPLVSGFSTGIFGRVFTSWKNARLSEIFGDKASIGTCESEGLYVPSAVTVAAIQASEIIKILLGKDYERKLITLNFETNDFSFMDVDTNAEAKMMGMRSGKFRFLRQPPAITSLCGSNHYQFRSKLPYKNLKESIRNTGRITDMGLCFKKDNITIFNDSRVIIKAEDKSEARKLFDRYIGN